MATAIHTIQSQSLPAVGPPGAAAFPRQAETDEQLLRLWLHGRPATTTRAYTADVDRFRAFVGKPLQSVTLGDVQAFSDSLDGLSDTSRARKLSAVKSLLSFGHRIGYLPFDVGRPVRLPRLKDTIAERILPEDTVLAMLTLEPSPRNKALLRLLPASASRSYAGFVGGTSSSVTTRARSPSMARAARRAMSCCQRGRGRCSAPSAKTLARMIRCSSPARARRSA